MNTFAYRGQLICISSERWRSRDASLRWFAKWSEYLRIEAFWIRRLKANYNVRKTNGIRLHTNQYVTYAALVVIALMSSVFFWPRSFPSKSSKLLIGGIIWKEIICPMDWYIKNSRPIKGVRVVGIEMGVPNCMQNLESVESWRRYWYRSGETK